MPEYGVEKCFYALHKQSYTDDTAVPEYLAPRELPGAVSVNADINTEYLSFKPLDDKARISRNYSENVTGYKGKLRVVHLPSHFITDVLGYRYENGMYVKYGGNSEIKEFALLFESSKLRRIYYDVLCEQPGIKLDTIAEKIVFNPVELNITIFPRRCDLKLNGFASPGDKIYNDFFREVH